MPACARAQPLRAKKGICSHNDDNTHALLASGLADLLALAYLLEGALLTAVLLVHDAYLLEGRVLVLAVGGLGYLLEGQSLGLGLGLGAHDGLGALLLGLDLLLVLVAVLDGHDLVVAEFRFRRDDLVLTLMVLWRRRGWRGWRVVLGLGLGLLYGVVELLGLVDGHWTPGRCLHVVLLDLERNTLKRR